MKTTGWIFIRVLRAIIGVAAVIFATLNKDVLLGMAGGLLLLMAVLNVGCCGANGCAIKANNPKIMTSGTDPEK